MQADNVRVLHPDAETQQAGGHNLHHARKEPFIQKVQLVKGVGMVVVVPVHAKQAVQNAAPLLLILLKREPAPPAQQHDPRRNIRVLPAQPPQVVFQRCSADIHFILQLAGVKRAVSQAKAERQITHAVFRAKESRFRLQQRLYEAAVFGLEAVAAAAG